jgi:hypothetical protein
MTVGGDRGEPRGSLYFSSQWARCPGGVRATPEMYTLAQGRADLTVRFTFFFELLYNRAVRARALRTATSIYTRIKGGIVSKIIKYKTVPLPPSKPKPKVKVRQAVPVRISRLAESVYKNRLLWDNLRLISHIYSCTRYTRG